MDINILRKNWPRISYQDLEQIMKPGIDIDGVIKCNPIEFFNLELIEVGNLYRADKKCIKFRHESNLVISKCEGDIKDALTFNGEFDSQSFTECGVNFLGRIRIVRPGMVTIPIKIFGEGSYDPGSRQTYLSKHDYIVINGLVVAALYSCKRGGTELFMKKLFRVCKQNFSIKNHLRLVQYMKYQIKAIIYQKIEPMDYATFLRIEIERPKRSILKKEVEYFINYLYVVETFERIEVLPCKNYIESLERIRNPVHPILEYVKQDPQAYIRTDPKFIGKLFGERFIDMRDLEDLTYAIEKKYSKKIKDALENRGEVTSEANMEQLSQHYYKCSLF